MDEKQVQILIEITDLELDKKSTHVAPSLNDAVLGFHEFLAAAFVHEIQVPKETTNPDRADVRFYKVDTEKTENGFKVHSENKVKLFEAHFEFWPQRLKTVPLESLPEVPQVQEIENLVTLN